MTDLNARSTNPWSPNDAASGPLPQAEQVHYISQPPYGQPQTQPYGQPQTQPYGQPQTQPYGQPQTQPYGQPYGQPFGQPYGQPYGQPAIPVVVVQQAYADPSIALIRDWLPWSIINMFIGWLLGGILPLIFSFLCRSEKRSNNVSGAKTMSTLALVFNILVTLGGIGAWIGFILAMISVGQAVNNCGYYSYCG